MHGVIIIQGDKVKFRDNDTMKHYRVIGEYNVDGFIRTSFYFKEFQQVEAVEYTEGNVVIKFSPI
jgi:hypothetical protein